MELYRKVSLSERYPISSQHIDTDKGKLRYNSHEKSFYDMYHVRTNVSYWFEPIAAPKQEKLDDSVFETMGNMFNPKNQ